MIQMFLFILTYSLIPYDQALAMHELFSKRVYMPMICQRTISKCELVFFIISCGN